MLSPRWRKLVRDLREESGRVLLMALAVAVSLMAVVAILGSYAILTREIRVSYLGTHPASATLELEGNVDGELAEEVRHRPGVSDAQAGDVVPARARVGGDLRPLLLFVVDDLRAQPLNRVHPQSGAWPPPDGSMLLERQAVATFEAGSARALEVRTPHGRPVLVPIAGLAHDPGLSPAWQERAGYGYISRATLARLGEPPVLHELRVAVSEQPFSRPAIERTATELAAWLRLRGHPVRQIRIPPPGRHPHQSQMETVLVMLLAFSGLAVALSGILVATSLAAMLARQVREIGVMKTVGARAGQIAALYAALVAALGAFSSLVAWPAGTAAAGGLSRAVAALLNFDLSSTSIPGWVFWVEAGAGVLVPLLVAALPIRRASRITVREAIDQHGAGADTLRPSFSVLPPAVRNALRRPVRLALTLGLLAAGGAMFMTALNVLNGWKRMVDRFYQGRHYDLEVRLVANQPLALAERLRRIPGVLQVEAWGYSPAAFAGSGSVEVVATYPDRGHGSFSVLAPPLQTRLVSFPLLAGRRLQPGDRDALVLNHGASTLARAKVGDEVVLSLEGKRPSCKSGERAAPCRWRVVGIVEEVGNPPVAYLTDQAFAEATGTSGAVRLLRIATGAGSEAERGEILRTVERTLDDLGAGIERTTPLSEHGEAVGGHVLILIRTLMAMAIVMAIVGMLGLGSTMGIGVVERSREIAVMRTVGATPGHVTRLVVAEALFIGALSWICALALSVPMTLAVDGVVGGLGFLAPLPLVLSASAALGWLGLVLAGAFASTLLPARRASRVTVREALAQL